MTHRQQLYFYYRNGCHLCEEMAAFLFRHWPEQAERMAWRDVDTEPGWRRVYGQRVPVLELDGQTVCELLVDPERIAKVFGAGTFSV